MNPDHAKRLRQRIETMNKLRGRPLTNVERLANLRRAFDEEDAMNKDHAKRVLERSLEALKTATFDAEELVGQAIQLLDTFPVADDGHYAEPKRRAYDLAKAKVLIALAIGIIDDTQWPKGAS